MSPAESVRATLEAHAKTVLGAMRSATGASGAAHARQVWGVIGAELGGQIERLIKSEVALFEHPGTVEEACVQGTYEACASALGTTQAWRGEVAESLKSAATAHWRERMEALEEGAASEVGYEVTCAPLECKSAITAMARVHTEGLDRIRASNVIWEARRRLDGRRAEAIMRDGEWNPQAQVEGGLARLGALVRSRHTNHGWARSLEGWLAEAVLAESGGGTVPATVLERPREQWAAEVVRARARAAGLTGRRGSARAIARAAGRWPPCPLGPPMRGVMSAGVMGEVMTSKAMRFAALDLEVRAGAGGSEAHWAAIKEESKRIGARIERALENAALENISGWAGRAKARAILERMRGHWPTHGETHLTVDARDGKSGWSAHGEDATLEMVRWGATPEEPEGRGYEDVEVFVEAGTLKVDARRRIVLRPLAEAMRARMAEAAARKSAALAAAAREEGVVV